MKTSKNNPTTVSTVSTVVSTPPPPSPPTPTLVCSFCDKRLAVDKIKKCPCKTTFYCMNSSCKKEHWKVHKTEHCKIEKALNAVKSEGEEKDDTKSGSKNKPSFSPFKQKEQDDCPICLDKLPINVSEFLRMTCCGKGLHKVCREQLDNCKVGNIRTHCPLCRTKFPTNMKASLKQVKKWVKKKKAWAQSHLGNQYYHGVTVKKDVKRATILFKLAAEQGYAFAQNCLGIIRKDGEGCKPDAKRAFELFTLATEQGFSQAQFNLANMYYNGSGTGKDVQCAIQLYTLAAEQGLDQAQYNLGTIYQKGIGTEPDVKRAVELFTLAAEQGFAGAQYNLSCMYGQGQGVEQSIATARELVEKAAAQGHAHAIATLKQINNEPFFKSATTTTTTTTTSIEDKKETASTASAEDEDDDCPICLEVLPKNDMKFVRNTCCGKGIHFACEKKKQASKSMSYEQRMSCVLCRTKLQTKDGSKESIEKLRFWVERGKAWSMCLLGDRYEEGLGVPKDEKRALELYTMAAEQDYVTAIFNLGAMYGNGQGTERDSIKAKELFMKAATLGHVKAILALKQIDKMEGNTTPSFTPSRTSCSFCGVLHSPPEVKLNPCGGCYSVFYCSKEHQITDWKLAKYGGDGHKEECKELQALSSFIKK